MKWASKTARCGICLTETRITTGSRTIYRCHRNSLIRSCARTTGQLAFALGLSSRNERTSHFVNTENNTTQTVITIGLHDRHTERTNEDDLTYACGTTTTAPEKRTTRNVATTSADERIYMYIYDQPSQDGESGDERTRQNKRAWNNEENTRETYNAQRGNNIRRRTYRYDQPSQDGECGDERTRPDKRGCHDDESRRDTYYNNSWN